MGELNTLEEKLVLATRDGNLYDFIANHYYEMSNYQLKEVLLAVIGVGLDNCKGDEEGYAKQILDELECRFWGID